VTQSRVDWKRRALRLSVFLATSALACAAGWVAARAVNRGNNVQTRLLSIRIRRRAVKSAGVPAVGSAEGGWSAQGAACLACAAQWSKCAAAARGGVCTKSLEWKSEGVVELCYEQTVGLSAASLFAFFANPAHLAHLMADWPGFRLLAHAPSVEPGGMMWFEMTCCGCIPVVLGFHHTLYEPPARFGSELIHGPLEHFRHVHEFQPTAQGTVVRDRLQLALPRAYGGELATRRLLAPFIERAFAMRRQALSRLTRDNSLAQAATRPQAN